MTNYDDLIQFATVRQIEIIDAIKTHGSQVKAAKALGVSRRGLDQSMKRLKALAARTLITEHASVERVAQGFAITGTTTLIKDGKQSLQWVKTSQDAQAQMELMRAAIGTMCEEITPVSAISAPSGTFGNLCNVYTFTDCHVGMMAWNVETQSGDWDLAIAEEVLTKCFVQMVLSSPRAKTCILAQLGDFLHYDSALAAITPMHGHNLDADGRMPKMVRVAVRILRKVIAVALQHHERVIVLMAEGNHDISSSVWLRAMFQALYENEPRVEVIDSELPYYVHEHGSTMLGWHHGHLSKNDALPILFASQFSQAWGRTKKRYFHTGHRHHTHIKEHNGCTVVQHPTLAARDAYAARGGWFTERQISSYTYSDKYGQVACNTVTPEMIGV